MSREARLNHRETTLVFFIALAGLAVPVLLVRWPPLLDYPNHYARMWLVGGGASISPLSDIYQITWQKAFTNIGIDVIAAAFSHILSVGVIAHSLIIAAVIMPPLGAACLNRSVFGGAHWWQVAFVILAWNSTLAAGFLNFHIGLGMALLGAAVDHALARKGWGGVAGRIGIGGSILFVHAMAFAFYIVLVAFLTLGPDLGPLKNARGAYYGTRRAIVACLPILIPLALFLLFAPKLPGSQGAVGSGVVWQDPRKIGQALVTAFLTYRVGVDALFAGAFILPVALAVMSRRLQTHAGLLLAASLLAFLSNLMPRELGHTGWIDKRLPPMAVLTFAASIRPMIPSTIRLQRVALALAFLVGMARTAWVSGIWIARQTDFASLERALEQVPSGSAILPLEHTPSIEEIRRAPPGRFILRGYPNYMHLPVLAIVERYAFVPTLFTAAGKQPIRVLPPWDEIAVPEGSIASVDQISDPRAIRLFPYLAHWRERFDFLLVVCADIPNEAGPLPVLPGVRLLSDQGFAQLYRIERPDK